jgi:acyl-CoA synthetase (AMP-forming)/AMP-acid ligase II
VLEARLHARALLGGVKLINLAELGTKAARCTPHAPALIDPQRGTARTFAELSGRVQCLAVSLWNMFGPGQRVAVLSRNGFEVVELYLACAASGSLLFPMDFRLSLAELRHALREAEPVAIFYDKAYQSIVDELHSVVDARMWTYWEQGRESGYEELLSRVAGVGGDPGAGPAPGSGTLPDAGSLLHDPFVALPGDSSAQTPKRAVHSQFSYAACTVNYLAAARITQTDVYLMVGELFDVIGYTPLAYLAMGRPVVIANLDDDEMVEVIGQEKVSALYAMDTVLSELVKSMRGGGGQLPSLRQLEYGGATAVEVACEAAEVFGADLLRAWAIAEFGAGTYLYPEDHRAALVGVRPDRLRSCGRSAALSTVAVLDEDGRAVSPDNATFGEICHRGPANMIGYWRDPQQSAATSRGGWLHSGAFGTWDADGYIYPVDPTNRISPKSFIPPRGKVQQSC